MSTTVEISLDSKKFRELRRLADQYPDFLAPVMQNAIRAAHAILAKHTIRGIVPWRTGNLKQSFRFFEGRLQGKWTPTANYALFVHEGTRRGIKPNPYMQKILDKSEKELERLFTERVDKAHREIVGTIQLK